jgi:hypothetical protein
VITNVVALKSSCLTLLILKSDDKFNYEEAGHWNALRQS